MTMIIIKDNKTAWVAARFIYPACLLKYISVLITLKFPPIIIGAENDPEADKKVKTAAPVICGPKDGKTIWKKVLSFPTPKLLAASTTED